MKMPFFCRKLDFPHLFHAEDLGVKVHGFLQVTGLNSQVMKFSLGRIHAEYEKRIMNNEQLYWLETFIWILSVII